MKSVYYLVPDCFFNGSLYLFLVSMGEAKDIQPGVYELQLGTTFDSHPSDKTTYHTLKCEFFITDKAE